MSETGSVQLTARFRVQLALILFVAVPLTASALVFAVIFVIDLIGNGTSRLTTEQLVKSVLAYAVPLVLLISPLLFRRYLKWQPQEALSTGALALTGLAYGALVPLILASILWAGSTFLDSLGIFVIASLVYAAAGAVIGPLVAIIFGPILRRIDPRYR